MNRNIKFWVFLAVFELIFGLTIFAVTRHYYSQADTPAAPVQTADHSAGAGLPPATPGSDMEQLMDLFPTEPVSKDPQAMLMQADNHFARAEYDQAARGYAELLDMGVRDVDVFNNLGITLHYLGQSPDALQVLADGIAVDPTYQRIWLTSGFVNSQIGDIEQARIALEKARSLDPNSEVGQAAQQMLEQLGG